MRKNIIRTVTVICAAITLALSCGCEESKAEIPSPAEEFYVDDFAGVISEKDAEKMLAAGAALEKESAKVTGSDTGAQVVAVTVAATGGEEIADYALRLGRQWGVGSSEDNNGVVILLATEDREIYVAVGSGLEGALPDSKTGRYIDTYGMDYFAENEFSAGMLNLYNAIVREVYAEYGLDVPESVSAPKQYSDSVDAEKIVISWAVFLVVIIVFILIGRRFGFVLPFGFFGGFSGGGGGRGGFSGFGGFSGGGGGFSGGGAGRSF